MYQRALLCVLIITASLLPAAAQQKEMKKWDPSPHIAPTEPLRPEAQLKKMKVPPGFEIQLVAADPDIRKPINLAFDAAGRLWVTETIEYPYPAKDGQGRDAVKILEDFGPDGRARKITTFADKLNIPIGVLPNTDGKGALIYHIPSIYGMRDTKGLGKADLREILYSGFGSDDTHGMTGEFQQGFDGWIYACHGYRNKSDVKSKNGETSISMTSGNTYRIKADGSRIEHYTHGQVNPFGLTLDPYGNLYSGDCHSRPLTMLIRGALYEHFANKHDGLGFAPHMNTFKEHSTALCGITYYAADQFPQEYFGKLFLGDVIQNRLNMYRLEWTGSTPKAILEDFMTSQDPWFRPVDVKLGPDGCLYVADFYNRVIGHYELPLDHPARDRDKGRIWRIVWRGKSDKSTGTNPQREPQIVVNLLTADVKTLVGMLAHANLSTRLHAADQLVARGGKEAISLLVPLVKDIGETGSITQKVHAMWVLERLGKLDDVVLDRALESAAAHPRVHALRILTDRKSWTDSQRDKIHASLSDKSPFVQRVATEALATHPAAEHVQPLARLWSEVPEEDTHLHHAVRLALRQQLRKSEVWKSISTSFDKVLKKPQPAIIDVCLGVHNAESAEYLQRTMSATPRYYDQSREFTRYIIRHGDKDSLSWAIGFAESAGKTDLVHAGNVLQAALQAGQERGIKLSMEDQASVEHTVKELLSTPTNFKVVQTGAEIAGFAKIAKVQPDVLALVTRPKIPDALRKAAIVALVEIDAKKAIEPLSTMLLNESEIVTMREQIASALASTNNADAHAALVQALQNSPARLQTTIALGMVGSPQGGERLLQAIETGKASPRLLQNENIGFRLLKAKVANVQKRMDRLIKGLPPADQKIAEMISKKRESFVSFKAEAEAGQKVFQKNCGNCHQIAGQGAKIGPQLDGIGARGIERLLEDVLDPNRNVDVAFRTTIVSTKDGKTHSGLVLREEGNVLILADKDGKEVGIDKSLIDERAISPLSPMPSNIAELVSEAEFHHLMAYLLSQRGKK